MLDKPRDRAKLIGYCRNPLLKMIKPIPASIEKDAETEQFVASFARGDCDEWGHGDTETGAMEDLAICAAESYVYLRDIPDEKLGPHLVLQKSILAEYFATRLEEVGDAKP